VRLAWTVLISSALSTGMAIFKTGETSQAVRTHRQPAGDPDHDRRGHQRDVSGAYRSRPACMPSNGGHDTPGAVVAFVRIPSAFSQILARNVATGSAILRGIWLIE
jgi:hypothetical protein